MNTKIFCQFFNKYADKLERKPYPGKIGDKIYKKISKDAWKQWMFQQTKMINEKKLNMFNINDRKILENYMIKFLFKKKQI
ncbi:hypothetical protein XW81_02565 [Buchnera aphidicola (Schlechtendalia chinensis)]|uniref:Fe(2+)-trafficking protein n=1 Tax=Buchnera aphidicola subsp. Schlechtendalia chinensis TaxID=118110 RepID=A0A172WEB5_BUCSC|nr:oxidative damage protection protein [Buchnera aphidicola]ANF17323.1 hypothetical protein XW81_02565 [Buchnera aphidicola (Schlechtendalia chinensis)]